MDIYQTRCKSIQREQDEVNFLKTRIESMERQQDAAANALELARLAKDKIDAELESLRQRYLAVTSDLAQQRETFQRDFMAYCPPELLALIFAEVTLLPDHLQAIVSEEKCFNKKLAAAPFRLAAVCSRWRQVALRQSTLWTYITSPRDGKKADDGFVQRNTLVLERSRDRPLDIFLCWDRRDWAACATEEQLLFTLGTHARRWRTFQVWLPDDCCKKEYLAPLGEALPLLQRLCFIADNSQLHGYGNPSVRNGLSFAPALREAVLWGPNSFGPCPASRLPGLRTLRLHQFCMEQFEGLLVAVSPTLESLGLTLNCRDGHTWSRAELSFPRLRSLALLFVDDGYTLPLLQRMAFPTLDHLSLSCFWIKPPLRPFLEKIAPSVTKLTLSGPGETTADQLRVLRTLVNVQELHFDALCAEVTSQYAVSEIAFSEHEIWVRHALWPRLSSIVFSANGRLHLAQDGRNIIDLIRWTSDSAYRAMGLRVRLVSQVVFDDPRTPRWLVEDVRKLLRMPQDFGIGSIG